MDIDPTLVATVATVGLGILAGSAGTLAYKYRQAKAALKTGAKLLTTTSTALDDDNLTDDEIAAIRQDVSNFITAVKALFTL